MSREEKRVIAIVPAYNEEQNIAEVIADLKRHHPKMEVVVVNDCSVDGTERVVRELGETVISLPINLGIGGAVQTGLKYACQQGCDAAIQFDGDGQHMAEEISKILEPVLQDEFDVMIGSRFLGESTFKSNLPRRIGIRVFSVVNSLMVGRRITDNTSGFRAYNRVAIEFLSRYYPQDYPEPEAVIELFRNGFRIGEAAVNMRERTAGESSIRAFDSAYYMIKVLMANFIAFSRRPVANRKG